MADDPDRHVWLELSDRARARGTASSIPSAGPAEPAAAGSTSCAFTPSTSTPLRSTPRSTASRRRSDHAAWAERTPPGLRVLAEAVPEIHAPADVREGDGQGSVGPRAARTWTSSGPRIDPLASAGKLGALLAQFPASFKNEPESRAYLEWLLRAVPGLSGRGGTAAPQLERSAGRHAAAARCLRRRVGADRRAEVPVLDPPESAAERARRSTTCACTAATPRSGGTTTSPRTATTTCTRPRSSSRLPKPRGRRRAR